ncbi:MAG: DUF2815 family protein [Tissierellia bacterium]|nr:DUF2815 family protein [Tissierellia bacterium]
MTNQVYNTEVTTGKVRLSYCNLFKPRAMQPGQEEKYSTTLLIPKSDVETKQRIDAAIEAAKQKGAADKWGGQVPPIVPTPIHDGDGVRPSDGLPYGDECKGHWVMTASANVDYPPEVVDQLLNPIINQSDIYSGCYARVNLLFYPYGGGSTGFRKGVGVGLGPVQKLADGEPLGGGSKPASSVFGVVDSETGTTPKINPITGEPM